MWLLYFSPFQMLAETTFVFWQVQGTSESLRKVRELLFWNVIKIDNSLLSKLPEGSSLNRDAYRENTGVPEPSPWQEETTENRSLLVLLMEDLFLHLALRNIQNSTPRVVTAKFREPGRLGLKVRNVPIPSWSASYGWIKEGNCHPISVWKLWPLVLLVWLWYQVRLWAGSSRCTCSVLLRGFSAAPLSSLPISQTCVHSFLSSRCVNDPSHYLPWGCLLY